MTEEWDDPDQQDAESIRLLAEWFKAGYFPSLDELPISARAPFGGPLYPWNSEDAWTVMKDVDRDWFMDKLKGHWDSSRSDDG
jgi:hypothetical protein